MVHQYKLNGYNIVLDTCSGSVHAVDEVAYDVIEMYESRSKEEIISEILTKYASDESVTREELEVCFEDIEDLKSEGKLFSPDNFEGMAGKLKEKSAGVVKALCLHIAHTCNLNCSYCFASQGKYHGDRAVMSFEVGKRALDFLIENSGSRRNLEVDFSGFEDIIDYLGGVDIELTKAEAGAINTYIKKFQTLQRLIDKAVTLNFDFSSDGSPSQD